MGQWVISALGWGGFDPWSGKFHTPQGAAKTNSYNSVGTVIVIFFKKFICLVLVEAHKGLPSLALVVKNPPANAENVREAGLVPGSGRSSGGGHSNTLQYSCLENPMDRMDRKAWWGYSPWGHKELGATENLFRNLWSVLTHDCYHRFELRKYSGVCLGSNYLCLNLVLSWLFAE